MMEQRGLDLVVAYADDRATFGPAHARWLANFPVHFEPVSILMPRQGQPVMLVGPESDQYALLSGASPMCGFCANSPTRMKIIPTPRFKAWLRL
ncbi:MAG: hypothetical protein U0401_25585 [Anaerolineae bacterium]